MLGIVTMVLGRYLLLGVLGPLGFGLEMNMLS